MNEKRPPDNHQNPTLVFSGTSYLGIDQNKTFRQRIVEGLDIFGNNFGGSRNGNTAPDIYDKVETYFANWMQTETSLLVSSGTLAATFLKTIVLKDYFCFYESDIHPSTHVLSQEINLKTTYNFQQHVQRCIQRDLTKKYAVCLNAVDPLHLIEKKFDWLHDLPEHAEILVAIDDSHGVGVVGAQGRGIISLISDLNIKNYIIYGSLGKALGTPAGFITGNTPHLIQKIRTSSLFAGASPLLPAYAYAFLHSKDLFAQQLQKLKFNINYFADRLPRESSLKYLKNYPVFYSEDETLGEKLAAQQILISSFAYPSKDGPLLNRIVLNANHTKAEIDRLLNNLKKSSPKGVRNK